MKRILSIMMAAALIAAGCDKYDDSELRGKVNGYESRIASLEASMSQLTGYQALLQQISAGNTVTAYEATADGYKLTFSDGKSISFSQKGPKGDPGTPGKDGDPGAPGTPGKDGDPGKDGADGKTPQFKIENQTWMVNYDGTSWTEVGSAIDRSLIKDIKADGNTLTITLADGTQIPVAYGQKEEYGFTVASGRKCFSFYETDNSAQTGKLTMDYALTGPLTAVGDVRFVTNITPHFYEGTSPVQIENAVKIEAKNAKAGTISVCRLVTGDTGLVKEDNGQAKIVHYFPGMDIDIMAIFPEGSVKVQSIKILSEMVEITLAGSTYSDPDNPVVFERHMYGPIQAQLTVPSNAGTLDFSLKHTIIRSKEESALYDGNPLQGKEFSKLFNFRQGVSIHTDPSEQTPVSVNYSAPQKSTSDGLVFNYTVQIGFTENKGTYGIGRDLFFGMKDPDGSDYISYWPIESYQSGNW